MTDEQFNRVAALVSTIAENWPDCRTEVMIDHPAPPPHALAVDVAVLHHALVVAARSSEFDTNQRAILASYDSMLEAAVPEPPVTPPVAPWRW